MIGIDPYPNDVRWCKMCRSQEECPTPAMQKRTAAWIDADHSWGIPDCRAKVKLVEYKSTISSLTRSWLAVPFCNGLDGTQIPQTTLLLRTCLSLICHCGLLSLDLQWPATGPFGSLGSHREPCLQPRHTSHHHYCPLTLNPWPCRSIASAGVQCVVLDVGHSAFQYTWALRSWILGDFFEQEFQKKAVLLWCTTFSFRPLNCCTSTMPCLWPWISSYNPLCVSQLNSNVDKPSNHDKVTSNEYDESNI